MKPHRQHLAILLVLVAFLAQPGRSIAEPIAENPYHARLAAVRSPELPARAAQLVKLESKEDRTSATVAIVQAALEINPPTLITVVGAISRSTPRMASVAAATAASGEPLLAWAFARTAAMAAPEEAGAIVFAVASAVPKEAQAVAIAVVQAVPESSRQVIAALGRAMPNLQPFLDEAAQLVANRDVSPSTIITQANRRMLATPVPVFDQLPQVAGPMAAPAVNGPFVPPSDTPTTIVTDPTYNVPPGWQREYSKP